MTFRSLFKKKEGKKAIDLLLNMGGSSLATVIPISKQEDMNHTSCQVRDNKVEHALSNIVACHSYRNLKPSLQMLTAESMFDPGIELNTSSRLSKSLEEIVRDDSLFPHFVQFMEAQDFKSKNMIRFWIQTECLKRSKITDVMDNNVDERLQDYDMSQQFLMDAHELFNKFLSHNGLFRIEISQEICDQLKHDLEICDCDSICFHLSKLQSIVLSMIESEYFDTFLKSVYFCKYQIDILTNGSITITDILFNNHRLASDFIEFMEIEEMRNYIDFLMMVKNYKTSSGHIEDAISILDKYFNPQSTCFLEMSYSMGSVIKEMIRNNDLLNCFDTPAAVLLQYFDKTYLRQFLESQFYVDYLTQCISSSQNHVQKPSNLITGSVNTHGSETSLSSTPIRRHSTSSGLTECDPESIWRRDLSGKLQMTYIDEYGKVTSELEANPDQSKMSNSITSKAINKAMKLVSLTGNNDGEKEDMAWKVAEMIVNDVCKMTQEAKHDQTSSMRSHK